MTRVNLVRPQPQTPASTSETFNGVKVFSATMYQQRGALGDVVTAWLAEHPMLRVCDFVVRQSSDAAFHCVSIVLFYRDLSREVGAAR